MMGGASITAQGVCYGSTANPDVADGFVQADIADSTFTLVLNNLSPNTNYHYRAYATNSEGTGYGEDLEFTTLLAYAEVSTDSVLVHNQTSATAYGNILDDGGSVITASGICWGDSPVRHIFLILQSVPAILTLMTIQIHIPWEAYKSDVSNSYRTAYVDGVGELAGLIACAESLQVTNCYSSVAIYSNESASGLIYDDENSVIENCFWDSLNWRIPTSEGGTAKTTSEMRNVATYTSLTTVGLSTAWDFVGNPNDDVLNEDYWIISSLNDGYPTHLWQYDQRPLPSVITLAGGSSTSEEVELKGVVIFDGGTGITSKGGVLGGES